MCVCVHARDELSVCMLVCPFVCVMNLSVCMVVCPFACLDKGGLFVCLFVCVCVYVCVCV